MKWNRDVLYRKGVDKICIDPTGNRCVLIWTRLAEYEMEKNGHELMCLKRRGDAWAGMTRKDEVRNKEIRAFMANDYSGEKYLFVDEI